MRISVIGGSGRLADAVRDELGRRDHQEVGIDDGPDAVVDLAEPGQPADGRSRSDAVDPSDRASTVAETLDRAEPNRYLLLSSVLVYAPVPDPRHWPIREDFPCRAHGDPHSRAFGQACIDAEDLLRTRAAAGTFDYLVLRPTMITGLRTDSDDGGFADQVIADLIRRPGWAARRYRPAGTMQWVDVTDVAAAVALAVESPIADETLTIAGPTAFTSDDLAAAVRTGRGLGDGAAPGFGTRAKFSTDKAATLLGWRPRHRIRLSDPPASGPLSDWSLPDRSLSDRWLPDRWLPDRAQPERPLSGQRVLITGASRGIGAETARLLAAAGADLVLAARSEPDLHRVAAGTTGLGAEVLTVPTDVADPDQVEHLVAEATGRFGGIDTVLSIAGDIGPAGLDLSAVPDEDWHTVIGTNLSGAFHLLRSVLPGMRQAGHGRIISISSAAAADPWPSLAPYAASRAGLDQLIRCAAAELDDSGIEFLMVRPLPTDTPTYHRVMGALAPDLPRWQAVRGSHPPAESALLLLWLCGPAGALLDGAEVSGAEPWVRRGLAHFRASAGRWLDDALLPGARR